MGVYIGLEMPKACLACEFCNPFTSEPYCKRLMKVTPKTTTLPDCPLIEVPEPHGDMKDINHINQVLDRFSGYLDDDMIYRLKIAIGRDAPTVIPASEKCE